MGYSKRLEERLNARPHWFIRYGTTIIFLFILLALGLCVGLNLIDIARLLPFLSS